MVKILLTSLCLFCLVIINAQEAIPKDFKTQEFNDDLKGTWDGKMFNNLDHPLAITGGALILGGAGTYITASIIEKNNYQPESTLHYVGIGAFAAGAVLFTIFSTDRDVKTPKRKKSKTYNAADWEAPQ